ncbi:hypothetical protein C8R44DRAFT_893696 [Mycena epipterygia]|nr:hypothetical protein C8R44DRAFT_893696 [Mycena epipterygia]
MVNFASAVLVLTAASATSHALIPGSPNTTSLTGSRIAPPTDSALAYHGSALVPTFTNNAGCKVPTWPEIKSLPAGLALAADIRGRYGSGVSFETNSDAQACVTNGVVLAGLSGPNNCHTDVVRADGAVVGPSGTISFKVRTGFFSNASYTMKKPASVALGLTASVSLDIAGKFTGSAKITNVHGSGFFITAPDEGVREDKVVIEALPGRSCEVHVTTQTCTQTSTAAVPYTASGFIRFKVPGGDLSDAYLNNYGDDAARTSSAQVNGSLVGVTKSTYTIECK